MISLRHVSKAYARGCVSAVDSLTLDVESGQFMFLLGRDQPQFLGVVRPCLTGFISG